MMNEEKKKVWSVSGTKHFYGYKNPEIPELENVQYILSLSNAGFYLDKVKDTFELPPKIYGNDSKFAERVIKCWNAKSGNLGVLLNGIKGSGKTVTSKMICNMSNLPVIIITKAFDGADEYLSSLKQDFIVFIDEYEKIYNRSDSLLGLMDGALSGANRRLFLLTTNEVNISQYMLDRPNRIRYKRSYNQVSKEVINDMVDDLLVNKAWKQDVIRFIATLQTLTIDIIGNIIEEVNIFNELPEDFKDFFNITMNSKTYNVYYHPNNIGEKVLVTSQHQGQNVFDESDVNDNLYIAGKYLGELVEVNDDGTYTIELGAHKYTKQFDVFRGMEEDCKVKISFAEKGYQTHVNYQNYKY